MPIKIMPALLPNILPNFIILLRNIQQSQIHIHNTHTLLGTHLRHWSHNGKCNLRHTEEILFRTSGVDEDDTAGIFETAGCNG